MASADLPGHSAQGFMAFWADIAMPHQPAYQRWHNNEHIPERLSIPGFVRGRRYRSVREDSRFLMYYDTTSLEVLTSAAYLARLNAPTPRTKNALGWFKNGNRTAYHLVDALGAPECAAPPVIAVASFAPGDGAARTTGAIGNTRRAAMEQLATTSCAERVLEYRLDDAGSTVSTGEASVHGATSSAVSGLLVLHSQDLALLDEASAWHALDAAVAQWASRNALPETPRMDVYSLEFALQSNSHLSLQGQP